MRRAAATLLLVVSACSVVETVGDIPTIDGEGMRALLADLDRPAVVNVWASWCLPCRSEAPLLADAHEEHGDEVAFIGIAVEDSQPAAQDFIEEFGLAYDHYFDRDRQVPAELGGFGIPITYFVDDTGAIVETHSGILDVETLTTALAELSTG